MSVDLGRRALVISLATAASSFGVNAADASRPLRLVVPTPPGSAADAAARALTITWAEISGRPVVVENIPGAGTTIGTSRLARAPKDGLTLGVLSSNHTLNPWLYKNLPYDAIADFTPIAMIGSLPAMLVVNNQQPVSTLSEWIHLSKAAKVPLAEGVVTGTAYHLISAIFKEQAGVGTTSVPYKGSAQVLNDVMAGILDVGIAPAQAAAPLVAAGKLKGLAVTTSARTPIAPDIPSLKEIGFPKFNVDVWLAVLGPAGLHPADVAARRKEVEAALGTPLTQTALRHQGIQQIRMAQIDIQPFFKAELQRNREVVQRIGMTVD
jgi:tripartite-type tricarboxylate transporter receptor subunit TctC